MTNQGTAAGEKQAKPLGGLFGDVIYAYTRKQAIDDGVLVDISETAGEAGFRWPVAVTRTVWGKYIVPGNGLESLGQSMEGRLWDVLFVAAFAVRRSRRQSPQSAVGFKVDFLMMPATEPVTETVSLKIVCGPGDSAEPVLTVMLPEED